MSDEAAPPGAGELADTLGDLLAARALSIGALDISVELNAPHLDCEVLFAESPDIGCTLDLTSGEVQYCELEPGAGERWLPEHAATTDTSGLTGPDVHERIAHELLDGMLAARRSIRRSRD